MEQQPPRMMFGMFCCSQSSLKNSWHQLCASLLCSFSILTGINLVIVSFSNQSSALDSLKKTQNKTEQKTKLSHYLSMWLCSGSTHLYEEFRHAQLDGGHSHDGFVLPWSVQEGFHPDQMMLRDTPDIVVIVQTQNLLVGWTHTHTHTHTVLNRKNGTTSYISSTAIWVTNLCERARSHWLFVSGTPPGGESCKLLPWPAWSAEHERLCLLHSSPVDRLDSSFIPQVTEFIIIKETTNIQINLHPHNSSPNSLCEYLPQQSHQSLSQTKAVRAWLTAEVFLVLRSRWMALWPGVPPSCTLPSPSGSLWRRCGSMTTRRWRWADIIPLYDFLWILLSTPQAYLPDICSAAWHLLCGRRKRFLCWCSSPH